MKRVAVTGIGVVSPLGNDLSSFYLNLKGGYCAPKRLIGPFTERLSVPIGASARFEGSDYFSGPKLRMLDRATQFALVATGDALQDAKLALDAEDKARCGVFMGVGMGGSHATDESYRTLYSDASARLSPFSVLMAMNNAAASWIGLDYGLTGPNLTFSTACSSSSVSIGEAWNRIRHGEADIILAGGTEAPLTFGMLKAWEAMRTLACEDLSNPAKSCKPFSKNRSGLVLGEGAAIVVLEEWDHAVARGAPIKAELIGYGLYTDAAHITRPSVSGQAAAMNAALHCAHISADQIDYINAHGTGTHANDEVETNAIKQVFGKRAYDVPISSTKSMHGHLLGGAGALEFAAAILALQESFLPPTMNLDDRDPVCDLDYVANAVRTDIPINIIMSNSFAFGGTNAVLIAAKA